MEMERGEGQGTPSSRQLGHRVFGFEITSAGSTKQLPRLPESWSCWASTAPGDPCSFPGQEQQPELDAGTKRSLGE